MSINKISPALKRYKPGEVSRKINKSLNSIDSHEDNYIHKLNEDTDQILNSNKSLKTRTCANKNEIPKFGVESFSANSSNNKNIPSFSNYNNIIKPQKQYIIDESNLDICFENLKLAIKNFDFKTVTKELNEYFLPETIFRKDSLIVCKPSIHAENTIGKDNSNIGSSHLQRNSPNIQNRRENVISKSECNNSIFFIETNGISIVDDNKDTNKKSSQNDSILKDSAYPFKKNESPSIIHEKNQKKNCVELIETSPRQELKNGIIDKEFEFLCILLNY